MLWSALSPRHVKVERGGRGLRPPHRRRTGAIAVARGRIDLPKSGETPVTLPDRTGAAHDAPCYGPESQNFADLAHRRSLGRHLVPLLFGKGARLLWVENCRRRGPLYPHFALIPITRIDDHLRPESVITFHRNTHRGFESFSLQRGVSNEPCAAGKARIPTVPAPGEVKPSWVPVDLD
jgi:hypothetical protein